MNWFKRYAFAAGIFIIYGILALVQTPTAWRAIEISLFTLKEMLMVLPPIFVLLGLLDVWVPRDTMIRYMGDGAGLKGILLAFLLGSAAAGPLYGAFPIAAVLMKKGAAFRNVMVFIGAWSTTKIPMLLFEMSALGIRFTLTRLLVDIVGIIIIAQILAGLVKEDEQQEMYARAAMEDN